MHARWVIVDSSGLCCCTCVMYFERKLTPLCVQSAWKWASTFVTVFLTKMRIFPNLFCVMIEKIPFTKSFHGLPQLLHILLCIETRIWLQSALLLQKTTPSLLYSEHFRNIILVLTMELLWKSNELTVWQNKRSTLISGGYICIWLWLFCKEHIYILLLTKQSLSNDKTITV